MTTEKLQALKKELTRHDYRYYVLNQPTISDQVYDMLYKDYEKGLTELIGKDTHSMELVDEYPEWIHQEFKGVEPLT